MFAYLLDSGKEHGLKQNLFRQWLILHKNSSANLNKLLSLLPPVNKSETSAQTEWLAENSRRIDVLIKIKNELGHTKAVVGIENKVNSGEQFQQIQDYQKSLIKNFPGIPKILIFLTPDGRKPLTSAELKDCPCLPLSYKSILNVCIQLIPSSNDQARTFIIILKNHIELLIKENYMETKISSLVKKLYLNPKYRDAIKLIGQHTPNIDHVLAELEQRFENNSMKQLNLPIKEEVSVWIGGRNSTSREFNLVLENSLLQRKDIYPTFMLLYNSKTHADIGSEIHFRIMFYNVKSSSIRNKILELSEFPNSSSNLTHWSPWVNVWVGASYRLVDLGSKDVNGLFNLLCNSIRDTYKPLQKRINLLSKYNLK